GAGHLVTFGITPERAETGFGYIARGKPVRALDGAFAVAGFVEKPDPQTAERYLASGDYFWNSGIFLFPVALYLAELERLRPEMPAATRSPAMSSPRPPATATCARKPGWWRRSGSRIWWWSRPTTRSWWRRAAGRKRCAIWSPASWPSAARRPTRCRPCTARG